MNLKLVLQSYIITLNAKTGRERGLIRRLRICILRFFRDVFPKLLAPLLFIPSHILRMFGVRFIPIVYVNAIGHLALEPDCYIKEEILGLHPHFRAIMLVPQHKAANKHLLGYWRQYSQYINFITSPILCALLYPLSQQKILQFDIARYIMNDWTTVSVHSINTQWIGRPPLLILKNIDYQRGRDCLRKLGVPDGAWFVCIHAREQGYRQTPDLTFRDVDIDTYLLAIEAIVERGGWCIRMGDPTMKSLPPMKNVIDYAHHNFRSDWMDIFLCASAKFFLGCTSGLMSLATIFGVPFAATNYIPLSERPVRHTDIGIYKLLWFIKERRYLTFKEILDSPIGCSHSSKLFYNAGLKVVDNSPEEIRDLALEMLESLENISKYSEEDELLQKKFAAMYRPGITSYGACSRIGRDFLRKYAHLL